MSFASYNKMTLNMEKIFLVVLILRNFCIASMDIQSTLNNIFLTSEWIEYDFHPTKSMGDHSRPLYRQRHVHIESVGSKGGHYQIVFCVNRTGNISPKEILHP